MDDQVNTQVPSRRPNIRGFVDMLDQLAKQSDPSRGPETAIGKDVRAHGALTLISILIRDLAGWAIDHHYGLALNRSDLSWKGTPDSHEHQERGAKAARRDSYEDDLAPTNARWLLHDLLQPMHDGLLPVPLWRQVIEGLHSLDFGPPTPISEPILKGKKRSYRALRLQLKALGHVEFRHIAHEEKKGDAQEEVARSFGVSVKALEKWRKVLGEDLGEALLNQSLHWAQHFAAQFLRFQSQSDHVRAELARRLFTDEALHQDGEAFKTELKRAAGRARPSLRRAAAK